MTEVMKEFLDFHPVLSDGIGGIQLIDLMGDDKRVVRAARVSTTKRAEVENRPKEKDERLLMYLMKHGHTSPFEMCEILLLVKAPKDTWIQWLRHRTASINETSARYAPVDGEFSFTPRSEWRLQSSKNHQGSEGELGEEEGFSLSLREHELVHRCYEHYNRALEKGVAREQARKILPLCTYTTAYWKVDLHNLFKFLEKRNHKDAQVEIRAYAAYIETIVAAWVPLCYAAWREHVKDAVKFSSTEWRRVKALLSSSTPRTEEEQVLLASLLELPDAP